MRYAISLGNSKLGRATLDHLLDAGVCSEDLTVIARTPSKVADLGQRGVQVREGSYGDDASMVAALRGVDRLLMVSGMAGPDERRAQHRGIISAAVEAGVQRIVYTSFIDTHEGSPFFAWAINKDSEAALADSGVGFTVLRNGMYSEADLDHASAYIQAGEVANNIGPDAKISYISRHDMALAATRCLLDDGHEGRTYTLTGPVALTQVQLAEQLSTFVGQDLPYRTVEDEAYAATFPDPYWGRLVVDLYKMVRLGYAAEITDDFERITGRPAWTLAETWQQLYTH